MYVIVLAGMVQLSFFAYGGACFLLTIRAFWVTYGVFYLQLTGRSEKRLKEFLKSISFNAMVALELYDYKSYSSGIWSCKWCNLGAKKEKRERKRKRDCSGIFWRILFTVCAFLPHKEWPKQKHINKILPPNQSRDNDICLCLPPGTKPIHN